MAAVYSWFVYVVVNITVAHMRAALQAILQVYSVTHLCT